MAERFPDLQARPLVKCGARRAIERASERGRKRDRRAKKRNENAARKKVTLIVTVVVSVTEKNAHNTDHGVKGVITDFVGHEGDPEHFELPSQHSSAGPSPWGNVSYVNACEEVQHGKSIRIHSW